jgi:hypothetical protein
MSISWKLAIQLAALLCLANTNVATAAPAAQYGDDFRPMDARSCTIKAMDAYQNQKFIEGRMDGEVAWGFNEESVVLVRCVAVNQGVNIQVLAVSHSAAEAERLRNQIRISVFDDRRPNLSVLPVSGFNNDSGAFGPQTRKRNAPSLQWGFDHRPKNLEACMSSAKLAMQKKGLQSSTGGDSVVWGQSNDVAVLVKCLPIPGGVSILVAATSDAAATAERFRNDIRVITFD